MSKAMWGGRFSKSTDEMINEFQASINFDKRMYHEDIRGSIAHARMLAKCGILTEEDRDKIVGGLEDIEQQIEDEKKRDDGKPWERARGIKVDQIREVQRRLTTRTQQLPNEADRT